MGIIIDIPFRRTIMEKYRENAQVQDYGPGIRRDQVDRSHGANEKKRIGFTRKGLALFIILCLLFSALAGFTGGFFATSLANEGLFTGIVRAILPDRATSAFSDGGQNLAKATGSELTIQEIINQTANAVVEIRTESVVTDGWIGQYVTQGAGSGVIFQANGYIMTNNHVIENARKITVTLKNGKAYEAQLVGTDEQTDVAVIRIKASGLTAANIGNSDELVFGDLAVAIGNPLGELGGTATVGIISALDREVTIDNKTMSLLQTDASINPGNSGGGLFNQYGELVGLVVAKSSGSNVEGIGFAIPINRAFSVANELIEYGYVQGRVQMGLLLVDISNSREAIKNGVQTLGVYVVKAESSEAQRAGFLSGDRLVSIEGAIITSYPEVLKALEKYAVGDTIEVTVARDNQSVVLTLVLGEKKPMV